MQRFLLKSVHIFLKSMNLYKVWLYSKQSAYSLSNIAHTVECKLQIYEIETNLHGFFSTTVAKIMFYLFLQNSPLQKSLLMDSFNPNSWLKIFCDALFKSRV